MSAAAPMHVMLCAFEPSGDALGAALMTALRAERQDISFSGCGGAQMAAQGLESLFPIAPLSIIGPGAVLSAIPAALSALRELERAVERNPPDVIVLIDSWTLSKAAAKRLKKAAPQALLIKYVAPQVWASRPHRAKTAAELFDGVLCLFDFEPEFFLAEGAKAVAVGHPGFQEALRSKADGPGFRAVHAIGDAPLLAIAPGSRRSELRHLQEPFRDAARRVLAALPATRIAIAAAPSVTAMLPEWISEWPCEPLIVSRDRHGDLYAAADAALAASGTVVTEIAAKETPVVVGYRVDPVTAIWARRVMTASYVSLPNIAANRELIPEFLQERCTGANLSAALLPLLQRRGDGDPLSLGAAVRRLAGEGAPAAQAAARAILAWIGDARLN
ncbi:MAG: lipid-A-disaccharide synthase [Parvularculaceae bacterium]